MGGEEVLTQLSFSSSLKFPRAGTAKTGRHCADRRLCKIRVKLKPRAQRREDSLTESVEEMPTREPDFGIGILPAAVFLQLLS